MAVDQQLRPQWRAAAPKLLLAGLMGFAGGVPLLLTLTIFQAWLTREGVDLATIGVLALLGIPYNLKFLWAPLVDRFIPPFLGRRRGWLAILQGALAVALVFLGLQNPGEGIWFVSAAALLVAFLSASQDVVIDAYRREHLADEEQGLGAAFYTYGYRGAMLLVAGGGLIAADNLGFQAVYFIMAGVMLMTVAITVLAPEPPMVHGRPESLLTAFIGPFKEFFGRGGTEAVLVLVFIVLYKLGDNLASHLTIPFYLDTGFSLTEIGAVAKLFGFWAWAASSSEDTSPPPAADPPLARGPVYGSPTKKGPAPADAWPTYRGSPGRSGCVTSAVPAALRRSPATLSASGLPERQRHGRRRARLARLWRRRL